MYIDLLKYKLYNLDNVGKNTFKRVVFYLGNKNPLIQDISRLLSKKKKIIFYSCKSVDCLFFMMYVLLMIYLLIVFH